MTETSKCWVSVSLSIYISLIYSSLFAATAVRCKAMVNSFKTYRSPSFSALKQSCVVMFVIARGASPQSNVNFAAVFWPIASQSNSVKDLRIWSYRSTGLRLHRITAVELRYMSSWHSQTGTDFLLFTCHRQCASVHVFSEHLLYAKAGGVWKYVQCYVPSIHTAPAILRNLLIL